MHGSRNVSLHSPWPGSSFKRRVAEMTGISGTAWRSDSLSVPAHGRWVPCRVLLSILPSGCHWRSPTNWRGVRGGFMYQLKCSQSCSRSSANASSNRVNLHATPYLLRDPWRHGSARIDRFLRADRPPTAPQKQCTHHILRDVWTDSRIVRRRCTR